MIKKRELQAAICDLDRDLFSLAIRVSALEKIIAPRLESRPLETKAKKRGRGRPRKEK